MGHWENLLSDAYKKYYKDNQDLKDKTPAAGDSDYKIFTLLHRFLTESLAYRGGSREIVDTVTPIVDFISKNPWCLKIFDEISEQYLTACINQPVHGFTILAFMVQMMEQEDILSKLNVAKKLMITNVIKEEAAKLGVVGKEVEVEFSNAMLKKVHDMLVKNGIIPDPWPGIPKGIAYEDTIKSHLTQNNIKTIYNIAVERINSLAIHEVVEYICERDFQYPWGCMVLGEKRCDELNKPAKDMMEEYRRLNHQTDDTPENEEHANKRIAEIEEQLPTVKDKCRELILRESRHLTQNAVSHGHNRDHGHNYATRTTGDGHGSQY